MSNSKHPKVVLDTNLLISAVIVSESPPHKLIKAWFKGAFIIFFSKEQIEEIKDVAKRKKFKTYPLLAERVAELVESIEFAAEITEPLVKVPIHSRDPEDDFILATAFGAGADYLITGDEDLLVLDGDPKLGKLRILSVTEFLKRNKL